MISSDSLRRSFSPMMVIPLRSLGFIIISLKMNIFGLDRITNANVRSFLEGNLFPDLREGLKRLVDEIHENGELDKYWAEAEKKNEIARRAARKLEKERKRLEMGSDYKTTGSTDTDPFGLDRDSDVESEYEEEESEDSEEEGLTESEVVERRKMKQMAKDEEKRKKEEEERLTRFNPVKYLATALQTIKDEKKANAAPSVDSKEDKEPDSPIQIEKVA